MPSEKTRAYLYRVSVVVLPLLVFKGVLDATEAPLWAAIASAVLVGAPSGLATANTSTK